MRLRIDPRLFQTFPDVLLGVAVIRGIDNRGEDPAVRERLRAEEARLAAELAGRPVSEYPRIAPWREAYRAFGASPKKTPSSIENLARRVLKGEAVRHVNRLVDLYNAVSLHHLVPVGGSDLARIEGDVLLTFAGEGETPVRLLGEPEARPPHPGEVIYKDGAGTLCRRWNWKEGDRAKLGEETTDAFLIIEALPPVGRPELDTALADLAAGITATCGGAVRVAVLDAVQPELEES